jgi:hypothetical protein
MRRRMTIAGATTLLAFLLTAPGVSAGPSCTAQFVSVVARGAVPFGQIIVVPEVRDLNLGGPNLGLEVKDLLATADKEACPVQP